MIMVDEQERKTERVKVLIAERADLIEKLNNNTGTNADALRVVQIDGLISAIVGSI